MQIDNQMIATALRKRWSTSQPVSFSMPRSVNVNRTVGAMLVESNHAKRYGADGLEDGTVKVRPSQAPAGQSFGAWGPEGS